MRFEEDVPLLFMQGKMPLCYTVGELVEQLSSLPQELPVYPGFGDGLKVVVSKVDGQHLMCRITEESEE